MREGTPRSLFGAMRAVVARLTRSRDQALNGTSQMNHPGTPVLHESCGFAMGRLPGEGFSLYFRRVLATSYASTAGIFECIYFETLHRCFYSAVSALHPTCRTAPFSRDKGAPTPLRRLKSSLSISRVATCALRAGETFAVLRAA